jgi:multidrug efflux pump subunit AcrA (membrane-fusion protein)
MMTNKPHGPNRWRAALGAGLVVAGQALAAQPAAPASTEPVARTTVTAVPEPATAAGTAVPAPGATGDNFGVEVQGTRLSANGYVIDLRYRVLDAEKARPMLDRKVRPVLVDESTGNRFYVPQPPVVGALRQTARNQPVAAGKTYFMIFANPDQRLKAGDSVTLFIGEQRFGQLKIEP